MEIDTFFRCNHFFSSIFLVIKAYRIRLLASDVVPGECYEW